jgi:type VI secretion system protein ImpA
MTDTTPSIADFVSPLAAPLDPALPSGENLEYDPQFLALDAALRGTPEVQYGSTITPAVPPDWQAARALALELFQRTRDLRVAVGLARALLALDGVPGLAAGLALVEDLMVRQWDTVHPQLEAEDDFDPLLRVNVLAALAAPGEVLRELRDAPLVQVRALGSFSLRDIERAREDEGTDEGREARRQARAMIDAAFAAASQDELAATDTALAAVLAHVQGIEAVLAQHVGVGGALDLAPLAAQAGRARAVLAEHLRAAHAAIEQAPADAAQQQAGAPRAPRIDGAIASRADVVRTLDRLCAYYMDHEPSSPVPLLLQRARRLVDKNFVDLLRDLAPEGLAQLGRASGEQYES